MMMEKMNKVRNFANAHHLLYKQINSSSLEFEYVERFTLDWDLYKTGMPSDDAIEKFNLWVFGFMSC